MESSRINYPAESEGKVNEMISVYTNAELAYRTFASAAGSDKITLHNFAKYFQARAEQLNQTRTRMANFQSLRGVIAKFDEVMPTANHIDVESAQEMTQVMKQAVEIEKQLEKELRELSLMADSKEDIITAIFAKKMLARHQYPNVSNTIKLFNRMQQERNIFAFDRFIMENEAEMMQLRVNKWQLNQYQCITCRKERSGMNQSEQKRLQKEFHPRESSARNSHFASM